MAGFIAGLTGAVGDSLEKSEQRKYTEGKEERDRKRKLVELAATQAIQDASTTGAWDALPGLLKQVYGEMDELGAPENAPKGVKDPIARMGFNLGTLLGKRHQQQQQQAGQQQAKTDVAGAPGVTATPQAAPNAPSGPPASPAATPPFLPQQAAQAGGAPGQMTPPMPGTGFQSPWAQFGAKIQQKRDEERKLKEEEETRKEKAAREKYAQDRSVDESLTVGTESRHYRQIQDRVAQLKKDPETKDLPLADLYSIAAGKAPAGGGKNIKGDLVPDADSPTGFSRAMIDHAGNIVGMERGIIPPVGMLPQTRNAPHYIPQADGTIKEVYAPTTTTRQIPGMPPTNVRSAPGGGTTTTGGGRPGVGKPSAEGTPGAGAGAGAGGRIVGQKPPGEGEMAIAHGAQGAMDSAVRMSKELEELPKKHPWITGKSRGWIADIGARMNLIPGDMRQILADKDSVAAFIMGVHRARGRGYADKWAEVIGDPFINPAATRATVLRVAKIAEAVQKRILSANRYKPISIDEIEKQMDKEGAFDVFDQPPPSGAATGGGEMPTTRLNPFRKGK